MRIRNLLPVFQKFSVFKPAYFDYQATTPIDYRVADAMSPFILEHYGNPHSKTHKYGLDAARGV